MSRVIQVQTNFTSGELDPKLRARIDLQQYYNGMETAQNIVVQPQGGFVRRNGSKYITTLPSSAADGARFVHFEFSVNDSYMLLFVDQRMYVFKDGVQITDINGSGNDYLAVTKVTDSVIPTMCWAQSADTLILVQENMVPQRILRGATDASWTVSDLSFDFIPKFAYTLSVTNPAGTITPDAEDGKITITASSSVFSSGDVDQYINASPQAGRVLLSLSALQKSRLLLRCLFLIPQLSAQEIGIWSLDTKTPGHHLGAGLDRLCFTKGVFILAAHHLGRRHSGRVA